MSNSDYIVQHYSEMVSVDLRSVVFSSSTHWQQASHTAFLGFSQTPRFYLIGIYCSVTGWSSHLRRVNLLVVASRVLLIACGCSHLILPQGYFFKLSY